MPELVADCPRCDAKHHTFIVKTFLPTHRDYGWKRHLESYCICKNCLRGTIFLVSQKNIDDSELFEDCEDLIEFKASLNQILHVEGFVNVRNVASKAAPNFLPENIEKVFKEGADSYSGGCSNAAAAMFRLCVDLATKDLLPETKEPGLNSETKNKLWRRLEWLFNNQILPESLRALSDCIRLDGNDGAHDGTITNEDAEDLLEFTYLLLERTYTEPAKLAQAQARRETRRSSKNRAA